MNIKTCALSLFVLISLFADKKVMGAFHFLDDKSRRLQTKSKLRSLIESTDSKKLIELINFFKVDIVERVDYFIGEFDERMEDANFIKTFLTYSKNLNARPIVYICYTELMCNSCKLLKHSFSVNIPLEVLNDILLCKLPRRMTIYEYGIISKYTDIGNLLYEHSLKNPMFYDLFFAYISKAYSRHLLGLIILYSIYAPDKGIRDLLFPCVKNDQIKNLLKDGEMPLAVELQILYEYVFNSDICLENVFVNRGSYKSDLCCFVCMYKLLLEEKLLIDSLSVDCAEKKNIFRYLWCIYLNRYVEGSNYLSFINEGIQSPKCQTLLEVLPLHFNKVKDMKVYHYLRENIRNDVIFDKYKSNCDTILDYFKF